MVEVLVDLGWELDVAQQFVDAVHGTMRGYVASPRGRAAVGKFYRRCMLLGVVWALAGLPDTRPLPQISAAEVRANSEEPLSRPWYARWARHFAAGLYDSKLTPLHEGQWLLARPRLGASTSSQRS